MAIFPIIAHFSTQRARSMHDVAYEFACAVRMRSSNGRERPKLKPNAEPVSREKKLNDSN